MAKSLSDIVRKTNTSNTKTTQQRLGPDDFIEYAGSNTDGLYVVGYKGDAPVKIKVRSNSCCDGIDLGGGGSSGGETIIQGGLKNGETFKTFDELYEKLSSLEENTIYSVSDKGTTEQYICVINDDGLSRELIQIAGGINIKISNPGDTPSDCPLDLTSGIIDYPLSELVNGDYFFKNHPELHTFISDTPSLVSGRQMFWGTSLTTFRGGLSALIDGYGMFGKGVKLDYESILYIVDSLSPIQSGQIHIGYDSTSLSEEDKISFSEELRDKGWTVTWYPDGVEENINNFRFKRS